MIRATITGPAGCSAAVLAALHEACFEDGWSEGALTRILTMPGVSARLAVAVDSDDPVGFVVWRVASEEAEIITIGVLPRRRNGGIGQLLITAAERAAAAAGARRMRLEVATGNLAALALYQAARYERIGQGVAYCRDRWGAAQDAVVMARPLAAEKEGMWQ